MSAVIAIRNATHMITPDEREEISSLIDNLRAKRVELNSEVAKRDKLAKADLTKRNNLLKKIQVFDPKFTGEGQTLDDLKGVLETVKSAKADQVKKEKRRARLVNKWKNSDLDGPCPDMDNDSLDAHIQSLLQKQRDENAANKKRNAKILSAENKRKKLYETLEALGLKPDEGATVGELQTMLTQHNDAEKQHKKDLDAGIKYRKLLDELILKNPDAGIIDVPNDASPTTLKNAVLAARSKRDNFKKDQKEREKTQKAKKRAEDKIASDMKKAADKAKKLADKDAGIKGTNKNGRYQAFTAWVTQEVSDGNIDQSQIDNAGGKGKYNSLLWSQLDDEQKNDPSAPWNQLKA